MKKVLIVANVAGMIESFNMPNIKLLKQMGYHVDVACNFNNGSGCSDQIIENLKSTLRTLHVGTYNIQFSRDIKDVKNNLKAFVELNSLLSKNKYEFIHCHAPISAAITRIVAKKKSVPVIYTAHGFHFFRGAPLKNWILYYPVEKICSYFTDILITINDEDYKLAKNNFHAREVYRIPGVGVDCNRFHSCTLTKKEIIKKNKLSLKKKYLIYIAEINKNKNQISLIYMIKELLKVRTDVCLLLVGEGDYRNYLENLVKKMKLQENVLFMGYRSDIDELLKISSVAVPSSIREGFGINIIESMASKVPVVAFDNRGHRTIIKNKKNGFLVPQGRYKQMAKIVNLLLEDKYINHKITDNAFRQLHKYSNENVLKITRVIYNRIINLD